MNDSASGPGPVAPTIRRDGTVLGFDVGSRRIGVAVGSAFGHGARALAVVDVHGHGPDWTALDRLRKEWLPDGLVVGDPLTLDGGNQPARERAQGRKRKRDAETLDAVAAAVIIERWLAAPDDAVDIGQASIPVPD